MLELARSVTEGGFATARQVVDDATADRISEAVARHAGAGPALKRGDSLYGMRDLLRAIPEVRALAGSRPIVDRVESVLGPGAFAVRGLWFDKTADANWGVPWHQDLTIAVKERVDLADFGPWTVKNGVHHVRPPAEVLAKMLTVRVHLDPCGADLGPLKVVPGTHRQGRLGVEEVRSAVERGPIVSCLADRGDAVLMSPLILHASDPARNPGRRRVVHLEYAAQALPDGLEWFEQVGH